MLNLSFPFLGLFNRRCFFAEIMFKMCSRCFFVYFSSFQTTNFSEKTAGFSGIQTGIVGVEGKHVGHLTTTTAHVFKMF